jgi:peptidoglycan/LPS O-acetylase OafA/YrhL
METLKSAFTRQRNLSLTDNSYDLLRLIMACLVVFTHSYALGGYGKELLVHLSREKVSLGMISLLGFFTLSGFLVSASAARSKSLFSYFCKRARRIFPGFWVCLVVTAFVIAPAIWLVKGEPIAEFPWTGPQSASSYVASNFFLKINQHTVGASIAGLAWPESINGSLWTLYLELGCYFVAAVFLVGGALRESRWLVGGALCASFLYHVLKLVVGDEAFPIVPAFYSFKNWSPYLTAFAAGAAAYAWRDKLTFSFGTVCVLALMCAMTLRYGGFNIISPLMVPALLLCAGSCFNVRLEKDFSYGIYIYSFPLQQLLFALGVADLPVSVFFLASLVLSVGCAWLSWHWVERPALGRPA